MDNRKELIVKAIENGTVIDHIPADKVFRVISILGLDTTPEIALFGVNLDSKRLQKKGIIKIRNRFFENEEINKIGLVASSATLITIKDYVVVDKRRVEMPKKVDGFVRCINPKCITNHQQVVTRFAIGTYEDGEVRLKCDYCEKTTKQSEIDFVN